MKKTTEKHRSALETEAKLTTKWKRNYDNKDKQNSEGNN